MHIIQTVNVGHHIECLEEKLEELKNIGIYGIRVNLNKYDLSNDIDIIKNILDIVYQFKEFFHFYFDIPYPHSKSRILQFNVADDLVLKDHNYVIYTTRAGCTNEENSILLSKVTKINHEKIIYFGDGNGAFEILKEYENKLIVKALCTFHIYDAKSISYGFYNMTNKIDTLLCVIESKCKQCNYSYMLSLLEDGDEIVNFKKKINKKRAVIAKIETAESINHLDAIIKQTDSVMLARGDMALLNDYSKLFDYIIRIIDKSIDQQKEIFLATDILTSIKDGGYLPSRSDIIDVACMIQMGCDNIVLGHVKSVSDIKRQVQIIKKISENISNEMQKIMYLKKENTQGKTKLKLQ